MYPKREHILLDVWFAQLLPWGTEHFTVLYVGLQQVPENKRGGERVEKTGNNDHVLLFGL